MTHIPQSKFIKLVPHPTARDQAIAASFIPAGSHIVSVPSLASVLLESEKGRRCDTCLRKAGQETVLRRCTGCTSFWYCSMECQNLQWKMHHKRFCKTYNRYITSSDYQVLAPHERMDALLLSYLIAQIPKDMSKDNSESINLKIEHSSPISIFLSLLAGPEHSHNVPAVCPSTSTPVVSPELLKRLYERFGNNNFAIHSHLTTVAHGIFPLASRLFNHSCTPNAVAKYPLSPAKAASMEIIALSDINQDEEICLPYLDPALLQSRHHIFDLSYGFRCHCKSCVSLSALGNIPKPPTDPAELESLRIRLCGLFDVREMLLSSSQSAFNLERVPEPLLCILHESFLEYLSESFSRLSHEGPYDSAIDVGEALLSLYLIIYPPNYPQIGMHLLELAKTRWNGLITSTDITEDREISMKEETRFYLRSASKILTILGPEGDDFGPLQELKTLEQLLVS